MSEYDGFSPTLVELIVKYKDARAKEDKAQLELNEARREANIAEQACGSLMLEEVHGFKVGDIVEYDQPYGFSNKTVVMQLRIASVGISIWDNKITIYSAKGRMIKRDGEVGERMLQVYGSSFNKLRKVG